MKLRRRVYAELDPTARHRQGLSVTNRLVVLAIILASGLAVMETEPTVARALAPIFIWLEPILGVFFLVEYVARVWAAAENPRFAEGFRGRLRYLLTPAAVMDLLAVVPTLLLFAGGAPTVLRLFRVMRLLRLARLGRMSAAIRLVSTAIYSRRYELWLTFGIAMMAILFSATLLYWAEGDAQPEKFGSIPRAMWWAMATVTTVGYGDVTPITPLGKVLASVVAFVGVALIALPTGIIASAFSDAVQKSRDRS